MLYSTRETSTCQVSDEIRSKECRSKKQVNKKVHENCHNLLMSPLRTQAKGRTDESCEDEEGKRGLKMRVLEDCHAADE